MKNFVAFIILILVLTACAQGNQAQRQSVFPSPFKTPAATSTPVPKPTPIPKLVSEFSTKLTDKSDNRLHNLRLTAEKINKAIINPNEEFSFNSIVGATTPENGYKKATVYVEYENSEDFGGGICQISSTIYNAALIANLDITERTKHKKPVSYIKNGNDAAVEYGKLDLKIKNNKSRPIMFKIAINQNDTVVKIYELY